MAYEINTDRYETHGVATVRVKGMCVEDTIDLSCLSPRPVQYWDSHRSARRGPRKVVLVSEGFKGDKSAYAC